MGKCWKVSEQDTECRVSFVYVGEIEAPLPHWQRCSGNEACDCRKGSVYLVTVSIGDDLHHAAKCHFCLIAALRDLIPSLDAEIFRQCYVGDWSPPLFITEP